MSPRDTFRFAAGALLRHRLRSLLSLTGVTIGVAAVVLLTALGEGALRYVAGQFEAIGSNLLIVIPGKVETTGGLPGIGGAPNDLTQADATALGAALPTVLRAVPVAVGTDTVSNRERRRQVLILGTTEGLLPARQLTMNRGRFLPPLDEGRGAPVAVLGSTVAQELFPGQDPVGKPIRVGDSRLRVIGVLDSKGTQMGIAVDEVVMVPTPTAMALFNRSSLFRIVLQLAGPGLGEVTEERVLAIMAERHGEEDVTVLTQDSVVGALSGILLALTIALAAIAAVSLSVAGIGIMNVMLVSVSERTSEVGLLKALGAQNRQVLAVFLTEAVLLSGSGGLLGLCLGFLLGRGFTWKWPDFPLAAPPWAIAAAFTTSLVVGAVFGVLPARRATALDPIAAMSRR
ncbi:MAG: ABC transporter permease [Planctomycetota bacterium]|nr:peptide ABC transporter permease [Planctomycetota bacterium]MDP6370383.1 ABC transporter permease [Planctomycetota bacterium]MDP6520683.1 ABC transporter permease [Planctomycetota bacterium]MDP6839251.1 ABC transporter permease [Planctomycetota bacterium]MDP6955898.1 ABC transporter permease [Planctomycetota bacterium]